MKEFFRHQLSRHGDRLAELDFKVPAIPVINNVDVAIETDPAKIKDLFFRRLYVDYADEDLKPENVRIERKDNGYTLQVQYEVRRPLIADLDIVGKFEGAAAQNSYNSKSHSCPITVCISNKDLGWIFVQRIDSDRSG